MMAWWWHDDDMMMTMASWWWHDDDNMMITWWYDDDDDDGEDDDTMMMMTSNFIVDRNANYQWLRGCVLCTSLLLTVDFTMDHCKMLHVLQWYNCKFTMLPDLLIVNLQCAGPLHCKLTVGTSCERDPKEMAFTVDIQWCYSGHTVN